MARSPGSLFRTVLIDGGSSVEAQTHGDWRLIARDDGSTDRTPAILRAFRVRHPGKVVMVKSS